MRNRLRSLRARVALSVTLTVVVIVSILATVGWVLAGRWTTTDERDQYVSTARDHLAVLEAIGDDPEAITAALNSIRTEGDVAMEVGGDWFGAPRADFGPLLDRFVAELEPGEVAYVTDWRANGTTTGFATLPLSNARGRFFETFDNSSWNERLAKTRLTLIVSSLITSCGGLIGGLLAGRRVARPLNDAAQAARTIAESGLSAQLPATNDPALADLTDTFNDMVAALAARTEMDRRFNSDVSHELRSPLTTLTASLAVLQSRRGELSPANRAALDLLAVDLQRFTRLVDDLLEISRLDGGSVSLVLSRVNIVEFLEEVVRSTRHHDVTLVVPPLLRIFEMEVDKRRIARVLTNLIDNAYAHGNPPVIISAVEIPPGALAPTHVRIVIEDHGDGVDVARSEELFERFNRGDRQTRSDGSGLGLALAREHVRLHAGTIGFEPTQRGVRGTRVAVVLPLSHAESDCE